MEEVRAEDGEREPLPPGLLQMHHGRRLPRSQTGNEQEAQITCS